MKKCFKKIISLSLFLCMIFILCSCSLCRWNVYTIQFSIKNISDCLNEDYFASEKFDFTRINGVVIIPSMKFATGYSIYLTLYSQTGEEKVTVQRISVEDEGVLCAYFELNKEVTFEINDEQLYEWYFEGWREENNVFVREENLETVDGNIFNLVVDVEVTNCDTKVNTSIRYEVRMIVRYAPSWYW